MLKTRFQKRQTRLINPSLDRVRLPRAGGAVSEEQLVLALEELLDARQHHRGEELLLLRLRGKDAGEGVAVHELPRSVHGVLVGVALPGRGHGHLVARLDLDHVLQVFLLLHRRPLPHLGLFPYLLLLLGLGLHPEEHPHRLLGLRGHR